MKETTDQKITPAMRQWHEAKALHPDKLLFFRMGDFYETFNEDAVKVSRLIGLTLTRRGKDQSSTPLAGIPHHQLDRYIKDLMEKGESIAVCDQLEDPAQAKGVVKRGITRVLTPGTVVDDNVLPPTGNNFLAAIAVSGGQTAIAFVDLSTGDFHISLPGPDEISDELERHLPAETLVSRDIAGDPDNPIARLLSFGVGGGVTRRDAYQFDPHEGRTRLLRLLDVRTLEAFALEDKPAALGAAGAVLAYIQENQPDSLGHVKAPRIQDNAGVLVLDRNTIRNLELAHPPRKGDAERTLLGILDHTMTGPGGRLLRSWIVRPSARLDEIHFRQDAVKELLERPETRHAVRDALDRMADFERIAARLAADRAGPRDLAALAAGCGRLPVLTDILASCESALFRDALGMDTLDDVARRIEGALVEEPPPSSRDGGLIRPGFSAEVDELRRIRTGGTDWLKDFQEREQARTGIPSLKVNFNKVFGFYIEITNAHKDKAPPDYVRKQTLVNAERYITPDLKAMEEKVLGAEEKLFALEYELFRRLSDDVAAHIRRIQAAAMQVARLDVIANLAEVGERNNYVMPEVHDGLDTNIEEGRHPVVENLLPAGEFVTNDCRFDPDSQRILIITGPNMAGKSTYIRQVAIILIMAHIGGPVPAKSARVGLADRVFSRVGASDDMTRGQSTFMVEMVETADILHNATERSLIILDEVGRGTSTFDGVSLAWAITEFLHQETKARTLFATHYHELAELGHILERAKNFNVAVREWENTILFLRRIQPGACDRSYGIQVGKMAGIPQPVIRRAGEILAGLEEQASERDSKMLEDSRELLRAAARDVQLELFPSPKKMDELARRVQRELADVNINLLSPMDAHTLLGRLAAKARGK